MTDVLDDDIEDGPVGAALPVLYPTDGCTWPAVYADCSGAACSAYEEYDDPAAAQALWEAVASDLLWNWTGQVFGVCSVDLRPCQKGCANGGNWSTYWGRGPGWDPTFPSMGTGPSGGAPWFPVLVSGRWYNMYCGCVGQCHCAPSGPTVITLPGPAQEVEEVWVDGVLLPTDAYRLDRKRYLVRTDGEVWPTCQDMLADPLTDTDTFLVRYTKGLPVPIGGQIAVGRLACELALGACGSDECALPDGLVNLSRQGLTMQFQDMTQPDAQMATGIRSIDWWVSSVTQPATFASVRSFDTA
jgi:hypothetical protein